MSRTSEEMNTLTLKSRFDQKSNKSFYDFMIDGRSLFDICEMEGVGRIGSLGWGVNLNYQKSLVHQFLNEETNQELDSERIMLFVCSECGDIGCGGTTFRLVETEREIIWKKFGDEDELEKVDFSEYKHVGSFSFEKSEYKRMFQEYLNTIR